MNPLLSNERGPYETPIFSKIKKSDYLPAVKEGISLAKKRIEEIKQVSSANFENTILALEDCSLELDYVTSVYYNLFSAHADEEHQALAPEISQLLSVYSNDLSLDAGLFAKVKEVYDKRESLSLNPEQIRLVEKTYKFFSRNGSNLNEEKQKVLRGIDESLAPLSSKFSENVLKATNAFELVLEKEDLEGLPESFIESSAEAAKEKNYQDKFLVTLDAPSFIPFLSYSAKRDLREKVWRAYSGKCVSGELSNIEIIKEGVRLKHQRAKLLGFSSHADYVLQERMAKTVNKVENFIDDLIKASKPAALKDVEEVLAFAKRKDGLEQVMQWDMAYYTEKLKEEKFGFSEEDFRPYFSLEKAEEGAFLVAAKLYGLKFILNKEIEVYHPDVKVYEVRDETSDQLIGIFYADYFPRKTKKSGAWMTSYREQYIDEKGNHIPQISIVCNFTKPTAEKPALLTFNEVLTLFHEFGHSLHGLLSNVTYKSLSGTSVFWDFVELPSQFMENFLYEKEILDLFAEHYKTKEKIPVDLIEKLKASSQFQAGYRSLRQLNFATLDMAWHKSEEGLEKDLLEFEKDATNQTRVLPQVEGSCNSTSFSHIFAGGYSAGYYSYKWAEVLDADAFEAFKEEGILNKETAKRFRENILSKGGTEDPMELYKKFRGREPDPKALLRRDGL